MYDENDIPFNWYSLDFFSFLDLIFVRLFGGGNTTGGSEGSIGSGVTTPGLLSGWSPDVIVSSFVQWLTIAWGTFVALSWLASGLLLFGLIYAYIRAGQLGEVATEILKKQEEAFAKIHKKDVKNMRWEDVIKHSSGATSNDWKLAIIEADILLGELLDKLGYAGSTIGEKLKSASPAAFTTINQAWRAHGVRNRIAHESGTFVLSQKEAQETISQYKMVFDEFKFI